MCSSCISSAFFISTFFSISNFGSTSFDSGVLFFGALFCVGIAVSLDLILGNFKISPILRLSQAIQSDHFFPQANLSSLIKCFNFFGSK
jgi:hypothetical protein